MIFFRVILSLFGLLVIIGTAVDVIDRTLSSKDITNSIANPSEVTSAPDVDAYARLDAALVDSEVIDPGLMARHSLHDQLQDEETTSKWDVAKGPIIK